MYIKPVADNISLTYNTNVVIVRSGDRVLAESSAALTLQENGYPPRFYFHKYDVVMKHLQLSEHTSTCPHKGKAVYYHAKTPSGLLENIAWSYPAAKLGVAEISGYIAFYEEKLTVSVG